MSYQTVAQIDVEKARKKGLKAVIYDPYFNISKWAYLLVNADTTGVRNIIIKGFMLYIVPIGG